MSRDSTVIPFRQPDAIDDPLTELAREGARRMLAQALIAEADAFVAQWKDLKLPDGRDRVVRHGHGPQRTIQTGVGPVEVRRAKVRDRGEAGTAEKIRFSLSMANSQHSDPDWWSGCWAIFSESSTGALSGIASAFCCP